MEVYWGYNPLTNHLLSSWDIQVVGQQIQQQKCRVPVNVEIRQKHSMARRQDLLVETGPGELTGLKRWINGQGMDVPRAQRTPSWEIPI